MADESGGSCATTGISCLVEQGTQRLVRDGSEAIDNTVESVANSALESFVDALFEFALWILEIISTWWMNTPTADVESPAVMQIQQDIQWYVMGFAILGFLMGLMRMLTTQDIRQGLQTSFKPIVNLIIVTGVYAVGITMLLQAGDEGALWLMERATGGEADLSEMFLPAAAGGGAAALIPMLLVYLLAGIGGIANFVFMIFRNLLLGVIMAFIPALAAATGTQRGDQAFAKANGWLIALLLFKPVAAGIYALGFRFMRETSEVEMETDEMSLAVDQLTGAGIILLAALALPALIKFLVPAAATGSAAFSGGAAVGAGVGVAAGAAVLAGTGGGAAAGGATASGANATGGASPAGGAASGGAASGGAGPGGAGSGGAGSRMSSTAGGGSGGASSSGAASGSSAQGATTAGGASTGASDSTTTAGGTTEPGGSTAGQSNSSSGGSSKGETSSNSASGVGGSGSGGTAEGSPPAETSPGGPADSAGTSPDSSGSSGSSGAAEGAGAGSLDSSSASEQATSGEGAGTAEGAGPHSGTGGSTVSSTTPAPGASPSPGTTAGGSADRALDRAINDEEAEEDR